MQNQDHCEMLPVGTTLQMGKYRVESCLASGGFGNTYVVMNTMFEKRMAMKEFFMRGVSERDENSTVSVSNATNQASFDGQRKKFKKEAQRLNNLHNTHIVQVHDLFDENGTTYYVMDYIDGESLSQRLKRTGKPLSEAETLKVLDQVLDALEAVHSQGIWHLDLKPGNVMMDADGTAKLIDFGASKQMNASDGYTTTTTAMCYTPGYAPLEQIDQKMELIGPWTDFYSLGATLYNLLTRKQPPMGSELHEEDAFVYPDGVGERTQQLIRWMMSPRRTKRPQSVAEVRAFLAVPDENSEDVANDKAMLSDTSRQADSISVNDEKTVLNVKEPKKTSNKGKNKNRQQGLLEKIKKSTTPLWHNRKLLAGIGIGAVILIPLVLWLVLGKSENKTGTDSDVPNLTPEWTSEKKTFTVNGVSFTMIPVEGGTFTREFEVMDSISEMAVPLDLDTVAYDDFNMQEVTVSSFYMAETEVTQELWEAVMGTNPSSVKGPRRPVETVNWNDCQEFIRKLNELTGVKFHLPTEAQWEFAARGGIMTKEYEYAGSNGDALSSVAWFEENSDGTTHDVAKKIPNELGLFDMSGNVCEWCYDWYGPYGTEPRLTNPMGPASGNFRVARGGSWNESSWECIVSTRSYANPPNYLEYFGFRLAL